MDFKIATDYHISMSFEGVPDPTEGVFYADGSINEEFVAEHYGLGIAEVSQEITFGAHTGTVAQMLADEACPIGGQIHNAYEHEGIEGVARAFDGIKMMAPDFSFEISEGTLERERGKQTHGDHERQSPPEQAEGSLDLPDTPESSQEASSPTEIESSPARAAHTMVAEEEALLRQREAEGLERSKRQAEQEPPGEEIEEVSSAPGNESKMVAKSEPYVERPSSGMAEEKGTDTVQVLSADLEVPPSKQAALSSQEQPATQKETAVVEPSIQAKEPLHMPAVQLTAEFADVAPAVLAASKPEGSDESPIEAAKSAEEERTFVAEQPEDTGLVLEADNETESAILPSETALEFMSRLQQITEVAAVGEAVEPEIAEAMTPAATELVQQISEALIRLEIVESEQVQAAVAHIAQTAGQLQLLEESGEDIAEAEQALIIACEELLDELGLTYEQATIEQFARLMAVVQKNKEISKKPEAAAAVINEEGTHEFKPGKVDLRSLLLSARQKFRPLQTLGQWALAGSLTS